MREVGATTGGDVEEVGQARAAASAAASGSQADASSRRAAASWAVISATNIGAVMAASPGSVVVAALDCHPPML